MAATARTPRRWEHLFYDTGGGGVLAVFEPHDARFDAVDPSISRGSGLPPWLNHLASDAPTAADEIRRAHRPRLGPPPELELLSSRVGRLT